MSAVATRSRPAAPAAASPLAPWWPLVGLTLLAAALRLATIDLQSFWYDEAFTPVHVLHAGLGATLRSVVHTENTPPLWYLIAWAVARVFGTGEIALRLPSALAGIALVPVAWGIGRELAGRSAATACAALIAVGPLFVWYSQEARAYSLFALACGLTVLAFLRARREPTRGRMAALALAGALALLTHYFAAFLLAPIAVLLLADRRTRRTAVFALAPLTAVGLALAPLISAQGGHGTQWIGAWPFSQRLEAIPQYYLTGPSGAPLGHGIELLLALPLLALVALGLMGALEKNRARDAASIAALLSLGAVLLPIVLVAFGADYLAPRNLLGAMVPVSALIAVLCAAGAHRPTARALLAVALAGLLAVTIDVNASPRLQRGNWRSLARTIGHRAGRSRVITTVELGAAPLRYYIPALRNLPRGRIVTVQEIDETGYAPLRASAGRPPAPGFHLVARVDVHGLVLYRFVSSVPRAVAEATLRRHVITLAHPEVLVERPPATSQAPCRRRCANAV